MPAVGPEQMSPPLCSNFVTPAEPLANCFVQECAKVQRVLTQRTTFGVKRIAGDSM